jgi:hypothetical protein
VLLLPGCLPLWGSSAGGGWAPYDGGESKAQANVRAAIPAIEAWNADHGTYAGMTLSKLRRQYDAGLPQIRIVRAAKTTYCVESTLDGVTVSKDGPAAEIARGSC